MAHLSFTLNGKSPQIQSVDGSAPDHACGRAPLGPAPTNPEMTGTKFFRLPAWRSPFRGLHRCTSTCEVNK